MDPVGALLVAGGCWLIGGFLVVVGVPQLLSWRRVMRAGVPVTGTVTRVERDSDNDPWTYIGYQYAGAAQELRVYLHWGRAGETIPLLVDPEKPESAFIARSVSRRGIGIMFFLLLGALTCLAGVAPLALLAGFQ